MMLFFLWVDSRIFYDVFLFIRITLDNTGTNKTPLHHCIGDGDNNIISSSHTVKTINSVLAVMDDKGYSNPKVSEMKVLSTRFKSKDDRSTNKKMSKKEQAKEEQERRRSELEEVKLNK